MTDITDDNLEDSLVPKVITINQFGAVPNSGKDATPAFQKALAECKKQGNCQLVFKKGKYDFYQPERPKAGVVLSVENMNGLVIDGSGSEMMLHGIMNFINVTGSTNVTLKNMVIDYTTPTHSMGAVMESTDDHFDVQLLPGYSVKQGLKVVAIMEYDPTTKHPMKHGKDDYYNVSEMQVLSPSLVRCLTKVPIRMKVGNWVMLRHYVYDGVVIYTHMNKDLKLDNITVYKSPGMAFIASKCTDGAFTNLTVKPRPGESQFQSAGTDGIHLGGCRGNILIDKCYFEGMGDDGVNLKTGLYLTIKEMIDSRTVLAQHNMKMRDDPDIGDVMEFMTQEDLITYGTAAVAKFEVMDDNIYKVTFDRDLPSEVKVTHIFGNVTRGCKATIRRVTVKNNRARGMLIQNRNTTIDDCHVEHSTGGGIWVFNEVVAFYESIAPHNVTVRNCTFKNVAVYHPMDCVLGSYAIMPSWKNPPKPGVFKNIVFEGNTIDGCDNIGILVSGTENAVVKNNTIRNACIMPTVARGVYALEIDGSSHVTITGNRVVLSEQAKGCKASLHLGEFQQKSEITLSGNTGFPNSL